MEHILAQWGLKVKNPLNFQSIAHFILVLQLGITFWGNGHKTPPDQFWKSWKKRQKVCIKMEESLDFQSQKWSWTWYTFYLRQQLDFKIKFDVYSRTWQNSIQRTTDGSPCWVSQTTMAITEIQVAKEKRDPSHSMTKRKSSIRKI